MKKVRFGILVLVVAGIVFLGMTVFQNIYEPSQLIYEQTPDKTLYIETKETVVSYEIYGEGNVVLIFGNNDILYFPIINKNVEILTQNGFFTDLEEKDELTNVLIKHLDATFEVDNYSYVAEVKMNGKTYLTLEEGIENNLAYFKPFAKKGKTGTILFSILLPILLAGAITLMSLGFMETKKAPQVK
ncbi:hypothetical protein [Acholeplasma hippikon]|nr:hypothetical protein [Acholeplasma hippikon]